MDSRIPHGWRDVLDRPLHPSELARLLHQVSLSLVHLSDQGGQSIRGFSRGCSNRIGWQVTDWLHKYSPCRRRCRASSPHRDGLTVTSASAASLRAPMLLMGVGPLTALLFVQTIGPGGRFQ